MIWNLSLYINLLVLAVGLATWAKLNVILKIGLRNISKRITRFIILNIYTPPQHVLTHIILSFKIIDKANSKFDLKIKEALYINWRKSNLNAQQNYVAIAFSLQLVSPLCSFVFVFAFVFLPFFIYYFNYLITSLSSFSLFSLFSILLF